MCNPGILLDFLKAVLLICGYGLQLSTRFIEPSSEMNEQTNATNKQTNKRNELATPQPIRCSQRLLTQMLAAR